MVIEGVDNEQLELVVNFFEDCLDFGKVEERPEAAN